MILKFLTKKKVLFLVALLLIFTALIIFMTKQNKPISSKDKVVKDEKTAESTSKIQAQAEEKNTTKDSQVKTLILEDSPSYVQVPTQTEQLLLEHEKIKNFENQNNSAIKTTSKKEAWEVNYKIGLEENAVDEIKNTGEVKPEMINGKVGFSKSF